MPPSIRESLKPQHEEQPLPPCPWQVSVGRQGDGWVFALEPLTKAAIERRFPGSCRLTSVFVGVQPSDDLLDEPARLSRLFQHVLEMLTELGPDELAQLGEIKAIDPVDGALLATTAGPLSPLIRPPFDPRLPLD
jgi:hypothetical protein